ncbi:MAG: hypothetical protein K0S44_2877 [Bacteroidetes bacterium]|jgi:hypothetical protein|nr:hypothetical protein [Bacteroidota bacterium]
MKNKFYKLIFSLVFGTGISAFAQLNCGTTEALKKLYLQHPELGQLQDNDNSSFSHRSADDSTVYIIPMVFHVIHTNGSENISDAQIYDQMAILNRDFRMLNSDAAVVSASNSGGIDSAFMTRAADCRIEFRLAQLDPNGNCTNGIDRIYSHKTNNADDNSKLNPWPRDKYLNIWVINTMASVGTAGYAYYPGATAGPLYPYDGIIILNDYIGSIGTSNVGSSRALTHEIGHYLNLPHTWGSTNDPGVGCGDDGVSDTPVTKGHTGCSTVDKYGHVCTFRNLSDAVYKFNDVTTTSGTTDPTSTATTDNILLSSFTANGVSANSVSNGRFEFSNWGLGAPNGGNFNADTTYNTFTGTVNTSKYYEFTVYPKSVDSSMVLSSVSFTVNRSATGPRTWVVRSSINNFASNLTPTISPTNTNLWIPKLFQTPPTPPATTTVFMMKYDSTASQVGCKVNLLATSFTRVSPVTFRIYAYNAEDAAGTFGVDSVRISGTNGVIENTENFMDYSYCSKMYTNGQKDRMRTALQSSVSYRNNLWTSANLAATGVSSPQVCVPSPDFYSNKTRICAGNTVVFTKNILNATPDSVRWTFYGGSPATSTSMSTVTVTYPTAGLYKVALTAYTAAGSDSIIKMDFIRVDATYADIQYDGSVTEDFEDDADFYGKWQINNYDSNPGSWNVTNSTGYLSNKSVVMTAHDNYQYDVDDLVSPSYDLSFTSGNVMTFRCAAASRAGSGADVNDVLKVYSSINCGQNWVLRATFADSTLINNGYNPNYFVPTTASQWALRTVPIPASVATGNVRFKFEYTTGVASNNVYIDDINISGVVGIDENIDAVSTLSVYPNPTSQTSTVSYRLTKKSSVRIEVLDVLGKVVFAEANSNQTEGDHSLTISKENLNLRNGVYFIKFIVNDRAATKKLIITQ